MNFLKIIVSLIVSLFLVQCGSSQKQTMDNPFIVENAYYQKWLGGAPGSGSGINVFLPITSISPDITLESAVFRGMRSKISLNSEYTYVARFKENNQQGDVIMSSDPEQEAANTPSGVVSKVRFPLDLSENEVGIKYLEDGKEKYTKVSNLEEKETIALPSAPPRDGGQE